MIGWLWTIGTSFADPPTAVLAGDVTEFGTGLPLIGADVAVGELHVAADALGRFRLTVPTGEIHVVVTAADHKEAAFDETLAPSEVLDVRYRLERYN